MASGSCCRVPPDCEPSYCRCTCPRCNKTKTKNILKAGITAAIAITAKGAGSKRKKLNRQYSYQWPGSVEDNDEVGSFSSSSRSRQSSISSSSSFGSSSFGSQYSPSSSVSNFAASPTEEVRSPFSPMFGKAPKF